MLFRSGVVRVAASESFANFLASHLGPFARRHPGIELQFVVADRLVDLPHGEADLAVRFLRSQSDVWHQQDMIDEVAWLIANHDLSAKELPSDFRLQALWDADSYEAARFAPGTVEGLKVFRERTRSERLCTAWAKEAANKRVWLNHRGWK